MRDILDLHDDHDDHENHDDDLLLHDDLHCVLLHVHDVLHLPDVLVLLSAVEDVLWSVVEDS